MSQRTQIGPSGRQTIRQFAADVKAMWLDVAGGVSEQYRHENLQRAAERELLEETGLAATTESARDAESRIGSGVREPVGESEADSFSISRRPNPLKLPDAVIGHPLGVVSSHPDYTAAKDGDVDAAGRLAVDLVTPEMVEKVRAAIGDTKPIVLPIVAIEQAGRNKIPLAVGTKLAQELGLDFTTNIYQDRKSNRGGAQGLDRVFIASKFAGPVKAGESYLLVDDTLTQGGTFAAVSDHVTSNGGTVAGIVALTGKDDSRTLSLSDETLQRLRSRFGDIEDAFREATGHGFDALTESEARTLASWKPADAVRDRILAERDETRRGNTPEALGRGGFSPGSLSETGESPAANNAAPAFRTWNQFQSGTAGQFATGAEAGAAWSVYKEANGIVTGARRSTAARSKFLRGMAESGKSPSWMNQWLQQGKVPPGYHVDHIRPLSIGGPDTPANMRLLDIDMHHHYYRPWE